MSFDPNDVHHVAETVITAMLGWQITPNGSHQPNTPGEGNIAACVQINGAWEGAVVIDCALSMAHQAAGIMFGSDGDSVSDEDVQDTLAELVNMIGGNLKALLRGPCTLSLPTVAAGSGVSLRIPGSTVERVMGFECERGHFGITILRRTTAEASPA